MILFSFVMLYPVFWWVGASLKPNSEMASASLFPSIPQWSNFTNGWNAIPGQTFTTFDMNTFKYTTNDSIVYFISIEKENVGHDIWKLRFTDFASADGSFAFSKQRLQTASVKDVNGGITSLALYPNPVNGGDVHVAYNVPAGSKALALTVTDITGKVVLMQQLDNNSGLHAYTIPSNTLRSGMYIVSVSSVGGRVQQKLVVN